MLGRADLFVKWFSSEQKEWNDKSVVVISLSVLSKEGNTYSVAIRSSQHFNYLFHNLLRKDKKIYNCPSFFAALGEINGNQYWVSRPWIVRSSVR